jgi:hypothetical protein
MPPLSKEFLISRGQCCGKNCLHCPYVPRNTKGAKKLSNELEKAEQKSIIEKPMRPDS